MNENPPQNPSEIATAAFAVTSAGGGGFTAKQIRHKAFSSPTRGVRAPAGYPESLVAKCLALQIALHPDTVFARVTAAQLLGIPLPPWLDLDEAALPEAASPDGARRSHRKAIKPMQWMPDPLGTTEVDGVRISHPARVWLDLANLIPPDFLTGAGDYLLRKELVTRDELLLIAAWATGRRGVVAARAIVDLLSARADSCPEGRVRYWFNHYGLPAPKINEIITDGAEFLGKGDFVFNEHGEKLCIEYDGIVHLPEMARRADAKRRKRLEDAGWRVITLTADDLKDPYRMCREIADVLEKRLAAVGIHARYCA